LPLLLLTLSRVTLRRRRLAITGRGLAVRRLCAIVAGRRRLLAIWSIWSVQGSLLSIRGIRRRLLSIRSIRRRLLSIGGIRRRLLSIRGTLGSLRRILILARGLCLCTGLRGRRRLIAIGRLTRLLVRRLPGGLSGGWSRRILVWRAWIR
jgi:hypothetical protein